MKKSIDDYTNHDLAYTGESFWTEKFFLESPDYCVGKMIKEGRKSIFEGKFNMDGFSSCLSQYISAKVTGSLNLQKQRLRLPKYQIGDLVTLEFYKSGKIKDCKIVSCRITKGKPRYDVAILLMESTEDQKKDVDRWTIIKNVSSHCVLDN